MNWTYSLAAFVGGVAFATLSRLYKRFFMDRVEVEKAVVAKDCTTNRESYWWRIKSRNGQIVATSETYDSARNARKMGSRKAKQYGLAYMDHTKEGK